MPEPAEGGRVSTLLEARAMGSADARIKKREANSSRARSLTKKLNHYYPRSTPLDQRNNIEVITESDHASRREEEDALVNCPPFKNGGN